MPTSVDVKNLKINKLTEAQYDTAVQGGVIGENELSVLTDAELEQIQVSALPTASADELGKIYQYIGATDSTYTNAYFYKCVSDGQNPATYSWTQVEVQPAGSSLPDQTGQSGKFLTTDGTDASWSNKKVLINTVDGSNTTSVNIEGINLGTNNCVSVGKNSQGGTKGTSVGYNSNGTECSCAYGCESKTYYESEQKYCATAIGYKTTAGADNAIQLGCASYRNGMSVVNVEAINSDANTFKVANANGNFEIMSADGTIPKERLVNAVSKPSTMPELTVAGWSNNTQTVTVTGVTATNTVFVSPAPASASDYSSAGIICTAQGTDSLTFTCTTVPANAITVNVVIMG